MDRLPEPELMDLPAEADAYAAADFRTVNQLFVDRLAELVATASAAETGQPVHAVDLGTGPADIPILAAARFPGWRITAVDGAPAMLELARPRVAAAGLADRITLHLGDALATGLPAQCANVLFSNSLLHHVRDAAGLWREIARLRKPGGIVLLRDLRRPASPEAARQLVDEHARGESPLLQEEFFRSLLAAYTPEEIRAQLAAAGLVGWQVDVVSDRHLDVWTNV